MIYVKINLKQNEILRQTRMQPKELDVLFGGLVCIGNAVPPPLSTAIAKSAKELLDKYYNKL